MTSKKALFFTERGQGPALVLVHGLMVTGEMFEPVLDHFAARYRVIVPDLRGHGRSRGLPPPYGAEQMALDLSELLDRLEVDAAAVLGYSHGGAVAQQFALDHGRRCTQLVLACTYAFNLSSFRERLEGRVAPLLIRALGMRRFANLVFSVGVEGSTKQRRDWLASLIAGQNRDQMILAWKAAMAFDSRQRLGEIRCPTLVLAGERDTGVPLHHARMLHQGIDGAQLEIVTGGSHGLIWTHTDQFLGKVDGFFDNPERPTADEARPR